MATKKNAYKTDTKRKTIQSKVTKVDEVKKDLKTYKTVALIDLRKLSDSLLQSLRKKLREEGGKVYVLKKPVLERVLESDKKLAPLAKECDKPLALVLTNTSPVALTVFFKENKKKRGAKTGEIAPFDIVVPEGETDLPPGPALSELKGAGLNVQIKGGKIVIAKESVVAKTGEVITDLKAKALQKLNIMPFEISVKLLYGYDGEYVYTTDLLNISEGITLRLEHSLRDAFNVSLNAHYPTEANITAMLTDAYRQTVNIAINGELYSSSSIEQILGKAFREGLSLSSLGEAKETK